MQASSGASGVLLLLERAGGGQRCYCANVGAAACLMARIAGSFNAKRPEARFLTREHTTRSMLRCGAGLARFCSLQHLDNSI